MLLDLLTIVTKIPHWWSDDDRLDKLNLGITFHRVPFVRSLASFGTCRPAKIPFGTCLGTARRGLTRPRVVESSGSVKQIPEKRIYYNFVRFTDFKHFEFSSQKWKKKLATNFSPKIRRQQIPEKQVFFSFFPVLPTEFSPQNGNKISENKLVKSH